MTASMKHRSDVCTYNLIRMATRRLFDDTRVKPVSPPLKPATATLEEMLAAKLYQADSKGYRIVL